MSEETEQQFSYRNLSNPARNAVAVTPNNDNNLNQPTRSLYVGTGGDVDVIMADEAGSTGVTFKNVPDGFVLPIQVKRVKATLTTASNIIALY